MPRTAASAARRCVHRHGLAAAFSFFLPAAVFGALGALHGNAEWGHRALAAVALLMAWQPEAVLKDRFFGALAAAADLFPGEPAGSTCEGLVKALAGRSTALLGAVVARLRECTAELAARFPAPQGWAAFAVDGTRAEAPRTADNEAGLGCPGRSGSAPQLAVTVVSHLGLGALWDWRVGPGHTAERTQLRDMLWSLPAGCLLVGDAGFVGYDLMREIRAAGRFFLVRVGRNISLLTRLGADVERLGDIVYLWPEGKRRQSPPLVLRLVRLTMGKTKACLLTNVLDKPRLSDAAAGKLYKMRWGIEVHHRTLKQTLQRRTVLSRNPANAVREMEWTLAGLWLLGLMGARAVADAGGDPLRLSPAGCLRAVRRAMRDRGLDRRLRRGLSAALLDGCRRTRPKARRKWPRKKTGRPPGLPSVRRADKAVISQLHTLLAMPA